MKKVLTFSILFLAIYVVSAQDRSFNFGLHGTPNISWMKSNVDGEVYKSDGAGMHMGYGAEFNYFFIDNLGIGTGIDIVYTGGKLKYHTAWIHEVNNVDVVDTGILTRKFRLQYIQVPLVFIGTTGNMLGKFAIYAKFGLGTAFKLSAKANDEFRTDASPDTPLTLENKNISKEISFIRESMIIGVGATYKVAKLISVNLGLNYNNGFTDALTTTNLAKPEIKENAKVNYFEISLGVLF
jgi:opacity protein-like surface antigen